MILWKYSTEGIPSFWWNETSLQGRFETCQWPDWTFEVERIRQLRNGQLYLPPWVLPLHVIQYNLYYQSLESPVGVNGNAHTALLTGTVIRQEEQGHHMVAKGQNLHPGSRQIRKSKNEAPVEVQHGAKVGMSGMKKRPRRRRSPHLVIVNFNLLHLAGPLELLCECDWPSQCLMTSS